MRGLPLTASTEHFALRARAQCKVVNELIAADDCSRSLSPSASSGTSDIARGMAGTAVTWANPTESTNLVSPSVKTGNFANHCGLRFFVGIVAPKRFAKSAVRRNGIRRIFFRQSQILLAPLCGARGALYAPSVAARPERISLTEGGVAAYADNYLRPDSRTFYLLVSLRRPFAVDRFRSAWSHALSVAIEIEFAHLLSRAIFGKFKAMMSAHHSCARSDSNLGTA